MVWTAEAIRKLGAFTTLQTAASIFGLRKTAAYELAAQGAFPVPVLRVGRQYRVPVAAILVAAQMSPDPPGQAD